MDQTPPPGFYPDPDGNQRWWDGTRWTDQVQQAQPAQHAQQWQPSGQWSGQPSAQAPGPGRSKVGWIVGCVVAVLLLAGGGVLVAVLAADDSDGDDSPEAGPEDTVQAYFDALAEDDCEGMVEQVTEEAANEPSMDCDTYDRNSMDGVDASTEILDTEEDGDEATVRSHEKFEHAERDTFEADCTYELVKQDDVWLIDDADCDQTAG